MKKQSFADSLQAIRDSIADRVLAKVPEWAGVEGLRFPGQLSAEQCSSSATARYKEALVRRLFPEGAPVTLDATGGLGVDSWFISRASRTHICIERDKMLADAAESNFSILGADNIEVLNATFAADAVTENMLERYKPDLIYLDPARRSATGGKMVLLEDCEPDVTTLLPMMLRHCATVIVKLSPMADISMLSRRLGECLAEVHVIGASGEVKELLAVLRRGHSGGCTITASTGTESLRFTPDEERGARAAFPDRASDFSRGRILLDPDPVFLKAGAFKLISSRSGITKAGNSTHLYLSDSPVGLGRNYEILEVLPFDRRSMADIASRFPGADVTARNLPIRSDGLKSRISGRGKAKAGCGVHVFAFTADCKSEGPVRLIVLTRPLS